MIHTLDALGDLEGALLEAKKHDPFEVSWVLVQMGRHEEALAVADDHLRVLGSNSFGAFVRAVKSIIQGDVGVLEEVHNQYSAFPDPEGQFIIGRMMARGGRPDYALDFADRAVRTGYANYPLIARDASFDVLRENPDFQAVMRRAEEHHLAARMVYGGRIR